MGNLLNSIIFPHPPPSYAPGTQPDLRFVKSGADDIAVVAIKSHAVFPSDPVLVFYSHGNAEDVGECYPMLMEFSQLLGKRIPNVVVGYDYSGYGRSTGAPSESVVFRNAHDALLHMMNEFNVPPSRVIVWGRSLGSGPTCYLAEKANNGDRKPFAGVVLCSPLMSIFRVGLNSIRSYSLPLDQFCNYERLKRGFGDQTPIFVIHGEMDEVVPFAQGKKLFDTIPEHLRHPSLFVPRAGHNDVEYKLAQNLGASHRRGQNPLLPFVVEFVATCMRRQDSSRI